MNTEEKQLMKKKLIQKTTKVCSCCKEEKNKTEFNKHSNKYDGLNTYCKPCSRELQKKTPEKRKIIQNKRKEKNIVRFRCTTFKGNTKKRHPSDPPMIDELETLVRNQLSKGCYYTGEEITEKTFGIDHKIPISRGGTNSISNLCVVSQAINKAKGNMTEEEFKQLLKIIQKWEDGGVAMLTRLRLAGTIFKR